MTTADPKTKDPIARIAPRRVHIERFGVELGPVVHVANERARLSSPQFEHITVTPKGVTLGAEISGVRLSGDLPDEVIAEIRRAWLDYKVVYVRDQDISCSVLVEFARRLVVLVVAPFLLGCEEHPELVRFEKGGGGWLRKWLASRCHLARDTVDGRDPPFDPGACDWWRYRLLRHGRRI